MKFNIDTIDIEVFKINDEYTPTQSAELLENQKLHHFIYKHEDSNLFQVVLKWEIRIVEKDTNKELIEMIGKSEINLLFDENKVDKDAISNAVSASALQLQAEFTNRVQNTAYSDYQFHSPHSEEYTNQIIGSFEQIKLDPPLGDSLN